MLTLHSVRGATDNLSSGFSDMLALVTNRIDIYKIDVSPYNLNYLVNDMAKIQAILNDSSMVICTTNKMLGPVGIAVKGGIKRAYSEDVFSTIEQRQAVSHDADISITEHVSTSREGYWAYPEYWVCSNAISHVWVDSKEVNDTYTTELSQLVGLLFGLSVVVS